MTKRRRAAGGARHFVPLERARSHCQRVRGSGSLHNARLLSKRAGPHYQLPRRRAGCRTTSWQLTVARRQYRSRIIRLSRRWPCRSVLAHGDRAAARRAVSGLSMHAAPVGANALGLRTARTHAPARIAVASSWRRRRTSTRMEFRAIDLSVSSRCAGRSPRGNTRGSCRRRTRPRRRLRAPRARRAIDTRPGDAPRRDAEDDVVARQGDLDEHVPGGHLAQQRFGVVFLQHVDAVADAAGVSRSIDWRMCERIDARVVTCSDSSPAWSVIGTVGCDVAGNRSCACADRNRDRRPGRARARRD